MRIVQLANLVTPTSGGIRTVLDQLGRGYVAAGHDVHRIVPARRAAVEVTPAGVVHHLPGTVLPGSGGYRLLLARGPVRCLLDDLTPDRVEVSDRFTLTWAGPWARARGVPAVLVVHERLAATLRTWTSLGPLADHAAGIADRRLPAAFTSVVVPSRWAASAFIGAANVVVVPLGVDLRAFQPGPVSPHPSDVPTGAAQVRLVAVTRLSREKRPDLVVDALAALHARGVDAHLDVVGDGPLRRRLERRAGGLPVTFHGFVRERSRLARLLRRADVALAPCGIETFGLAVLEAMACGTPVVATTGGAVGELVADGSGVVVPPGGREMAAGALRLLDRDPDDRRAAARARAEAHPWGATVRRMLAVHGLPARADGAAGGHRSRSVG